MLSKKGVSQAFIILSSALIIMAILVIALKAYIVVDGNSRIDYADFQRKITTDASAISDSIGAVQSFTYFVPKEYTKVCFVQLHPPVDYSSMPQMIKDSINQGVADNIFLLAGDDHIDSFEVPGMMLKYDPFADCIMLKEGKLTLRMSSNAAGALIHIPNESSCKTANDNGNCDTLDTTFGNGYRAECCSMYGTCC